MANARSIGNLWLETGEGLPVTTLLDESGRECGVILGFLIDPVRRNMPDTSWQASVAFDPSAPERFALAALRALAGRFLLIITASRDVQIYPDVAAQLPCVLDRESGDAGSSAYALLDDEAYEDRLDRVLYNRLGVNGEGWFPAGLTAHRGIERLLPGHVLDVAQGRIRRFWPIAAIPPCGDPQAVVTEMIDLVRAQTEALLMGDKRVTFALTGGKDTRVLLACARPYLDRISFVTVTGDGRHHNDTVIARMIAEKFGLDQALLRKCG